MDPLEEVVERRAGVKRSETNEQRKVGNPTCQRGEGAKWIKVKTKQGRAAEPSKPAELGKSRSGLQFH